MKKILVYYMAKDKKTITFLPIIIILIWEKQVQLLHYSLS
jgi:hypothetical protein